jgi:hypothetical protein
MLTMPSFTARLRTVLRHGMAGALLAGRSRRRRALGLLGCLLGLALLGGLQGCVVRGRQDSTPAGTYDLTVTATAPGDHPGSATLRLTVK